MLRRLIVMRHAKSSWDSDAGDDHSRPLNKRGRRDAPLVAAHLQQMGWTPEVVYSSDALRTRETLERMLKAWSPQPKVEYLSSLYHAGVHAIRETVALTTPDVSTVLVLGHNPGWQHAVAWLSGEHIEMTTANAALLETKDDQWRDALVGEGHWHLVNVIRPKEILAAD